MTTISVPINKEQEKFLKARVKSGVSANTAHAVRQAVDALAEQEAIATILQAMNEPTLKGDLRKLSEQF